MSSAYASAWNAPDGINDTAMDPVLVSTVNHDGTETRGLTSFNTSAKRSSPPASQRFTRSHLTTSHREIAPSVSLART
jgi:hypothetical protein